MKKHLLFFAFLLFFSISKSQTQDLATLASGEYLGFNALFDEDDNLFGYVSLYGYGKSSDKTKKFEYVILDKNLNPVANKEFQGDITARDYFGYMDFRKKIILRPTNYDLSGIKLRDAYMPRSKEIDITTNTIIDKDFFEYENNKFVKVTEPESWKKERKENKEEKKQKGYNYRSFVFEIKEGGFLVLEFNDYGSYINNNSLIKFDSNQKEAWRYQYNTSGDKKINEQISLIEKDENYIYFLHQKNEKKEKQFNLLVLDMKTGKEVHKKLISGLNQNTLDRITGFLTYSYGAIKNDKTYDDKIVLVGRNIDDNSKYSGFARMLIDRKTFNVKTDIITYESLQNQIPKLSDNGQVESGYFLDPRDLYILKDGSVGILLEKYKPQGQYNASKTTDMIYIFTDKDFQTKGVKIFDKEKTRWSNSDYLFSQYLNDGNDVVFFYRDYQKDDVTKEKNWNLFINSFIDGKFNQEVVPISAKKEFFVSPYVGKEGYILLREFNEKEKFNKIRLERLNY